MTKTKLYCFGKLKFQELKALEKDYIKKINFFTNIQIIQLKDIKEKNEKVLKVKEGEEILKHIKRSCFNILLDERGKTFTSKEFANFIKEKEEIHPEIIFFMGGHCGVSKDIKDKFNFSISFSSMTFPHDLFRIIFLEQLYRAYSINNNINYHR